MRKPKDWDWAKLIVNGIYTIAVTLALSCIHPSVSVNAAAGLAGVTAMLGFLTDALTAKPPTEKE